MGKDRKTTVQQRIDPESQQFVDRMRGHSQQLATAPLNISPFMNPFMDAIRGEFDHLRGQASMATAQDATGANAFGGSRAAVLEGTRLGEIDRAQGTAIASQVQQAIQAALMDRLHRGQIMNLGLGPTGMDAIQTLRPGALDWITGILGSMPMPIPGG